MKKIYISFSILFVAVFSSLSTFAQLTVTSYDDQSTWGDVMNGDTIHVDGSYTQTYTEGGITYNITGVELAIMDLDASTWATVVEHRVVVANATIGDLASGIINKDILVPADFPLTSTAPTNHWLVQTRAWYGTADAPKTVTSQYKNAYLTVVAGGITPAENPPAGIYIDTYEAGNSEYGTYGDVVHGETIHIDGTFSQTYDQDGVTYPVNSVTISILGFTSGWANNGHNQVIVIDDANTGDLSSSIINSDLVVADSLPINDDLPEGDFYLFQTRVNYGTEEAPNTVSLWSNAWMTISAGTTAVFDKLSESGIDVYPNPAKAGETIRIRSNDLSGTVNVKIFNILGAEIYNKAKPISNLKIDTHGFAPGLYNVLVKGSSKFAMQKLIVTQ